MLFCIISITNAQEAVPFTPRLDGGNIEVRGDIIFVGNNILNRASEANPTEANTAYSGTANNNSLWMEYIDIDGDVDTFSSSSAELNLTDISCSKIIYAGLYWAATYPNERSTEGGASFSGTNRIEDWNEIKFKIPSGTYIDLIADTATDPIGEEDDIIFDGYDYTDINNSFKDSPYICYKNVTDIVNTNTNPNGEYTVANIRATKGIRNGSSSAGWVMVIIYENPTESGKFISTFDGYAGLSGAVGNVDVDVNGFKTLPNPFPVNARIGVGALEGDRGITNDRFYLKANSNATFTNLSTVLNPDNNFFNSTITTNDTQVATRTPYGTNTLGIDLDLFNLTNPSESVLPNDETGATLRFTSSGDGYGAFLTSFSVEIIEPDIVLEKRVEDIAGNDITGLGVNLGQILDYVLTFSNIGNDDGTGIDPTSSNLFEKYYTIRDVLPINVTLDESNIILPTGVTYTYDSSTNEIKFSIPDNLVLMDGPETSIRMRVKVAENCFDFVDACSDLIENIAYSSYSGILNSAVITDDPSVSNYDDCGFITPGATNFLLDDLSDCNFSRTVQLCGDNALLDAGDNFDNYIWYIDVNENGLIDLGIDTVIDDGNSDGDLSTQLVTQPGIYIVDKIVEDPCKGFQEIITVEYYGTVDTNPIIDYFNTQNSDSDDSNDIQGEILRCSIDGESIANIFLCGINDTELLQVNIPDADSIEWEQLDEANCSSTDPSCPNKGATCYSTIATGNSYEVSESGSYRLVINYLNGCSSRYYFSVYKNELEILTTKTDIFCETDGNITVTNLGSDYGFQLYDTANNTIIIPFSANNGNSFDISTSGSYRVDIRQLDATGNTIDDSCEFQSEEIGILDRDFEVELEATAANCNELGKINIQILNVRENYTYDLRFNDGTINSYGIGTRVNLVTAETNNNYTFENLNPDDYTIIVTTQDGCTDTQYITVEEVEEITLSAVTLTNIGCSPGTIQLTADGGFPNPNYSYAIWSKDGIELYANINDIPGNLYQIENVFEFGYTVSGGPTDDNPDAEYIYTKVSGEEGTYQFIAVDANGCYKISNTVTIEDVGNMTIEIDNSASTPITCNSSSDASIIINTTGGLAPYEYSIDDGVNYQDQNIFLNLSPGTYDISVLDSSGCSEKLEYTISEPNEIIAEAIQTKEYTCLPSGEAEITVGSVTATTGGSGNYQYNINGSSWTSSTTGGTVFTGLTDGTYTIQVRDANATNCVIILSDIIIDPLPTEPTLNDSIIYNCNGTANINITPFDASYSYAIDGATPQTGTDANIFNDIASGNHTIEVNYGNECTTSITVNIESGKEFTASVTNPINVTCFGDSNGEFTINATNFGINGYEYSLDGTNFIGPFTTSETVTTLTAQTYSITVRDIDNPTICTITLTQELTQPNEIIASALITTEYTCANTGATITASATGGTPTYEYQLEDSSGNVIGSYDFVTNGSNTSFIDLTVGDYIVVAKDINNCEDPINAPIIVNAPQIPTFTATPTACYSGTNDGTIEVDITSIPGNENFQFSINGGGWITPNPSTDTTYTFTGLANGSYTIDVKDGFGCEATQQTVVLNPVINATIDVTHVSSCDDGNITVNATGGDGNFMYAFVTTGTTITSTDFISSNSYTVDALNAGTYDVYVWDNNGIYPHCEYTETVTVDPATTLTYTAIPTDPECHDGTGSIDINVSSGIAPYTYEIIDLDNGGASDETTTNDINNTKTFFNLSAGNYTINVTDASGCTIQTTPVTINNPDELVAEIESNLTDDCDPATGFRFINYTTTLNGILEFSHDGGTTWQTSDDFDAPTYTLTSGDAVDPSIRTVDASGNTLCRLDLPRYIIAYPLDNLDITIAAIIVNCNELQVSVQGNEGTAPYQYTYTDDPFNFDASTPSNPWTTPAKGLSDPHTFTGLIPGRTYMFFVRDANGCIRQSDVNVNDLITLPLEITSTSNPACFGMSNGSITYTITDNESPFGTEFRWEVFNMSTGTPVSIDSSGGNIPFSSPQTVTVSSLGAGEYFIQVTERDSGVDSCISASENLLLEELDDITATLNKIQDISCATSGLIQIENINGGGGTYTFTVTGPAPFTTITGTTDNPIEIPANSPAGTYNVTIQDQYSCAKDLGDVIMTLTPNPTIDSIDVNNCAIPNTLQINATSIATEILYSIDGGTTYLDNGGSFTNLANGTYTIFIKDSNGCTATDTATIHPILEANVQLTKLMDCTPGTAEITIEAINGSGNYDYEITNTLGTVVSRTALTTNPFVASLTVVDTYTVTIYDNNTTGPECSKVFTIEVEDAVEPEINTIASTDITCAGDDNGTITVTTLDNGTGPYTFEITSLDGTPQSIAPISTTNTSATFTGLAPTNTTDGYIVTVTGDATTNNCSTDSASILIVEPTAVSVSINPLVDVVQFTCTPDTNTDNNASITINTVTGGSGTYVRYVFENTTTSTIVQDGTNIEYIETNRLGGDYIITVYDDNGCFDTATVTIQPFVKIYDPTIIVDNSVTCNGDDENITVGVTIDPVTATPNLTYTVTSTNGYNETFNSSLNSQTFTALGIGNYIITITNNDTGCFVTTVHEVKDPKEIEVTAIKLTDENCLNDGVDDGSFSVTIDGYTGSYYYQLYSSDGTSIGTVQTGNTNTPLIIDNLEGGGYYIEITETDATSTFCTDASNVIIINTPEFEITATVSEESNVTCDNDSGSILVDPTGGEAPYTITITSATYTETQTDVSAYLFQDLSAGDFTITITDALGCMNTDYSIELIEPLPITATISADIQLDCYGDDTGFVTATVTSGGLGTLKYQLNTYDASETTIITTSVAQSSNTFSGLFAGKYSITVSDDVSCFGETPIATISDPIDVFGSLTLIQNITCVNDVELLLTANGGTAPYSYSVDGTNYFTFNNGDEHIFNTLPSGNSGAGTYRYYVQDSFNCISTLSNEIVVDEVEPITYNIDTSAATINCNGDNTAIISIRADGGLGNYEYQLLDTATSTTPLDTNVNGVFRDLIAGDYYIRIISEDCEEVTTVIEITEPTPLTYTDDYSTMICAGDNNGYINITLSGGSGNYQYAISPNLAQFDDENSFTDLDPGTYIIIAQDANGCFIQNEYIIEESTEINIVATPTGETCLGNEDGNIDLEITGGVAPYSTRLENTSYVLNQISYTGLASGTHTIYVIDDLGCETNIDVNIDNGVNIKATVQPIYECTGDTPNNSLNVILDDTSVEGMVIYQLDDINSVDARLEPNFTNISAGDHTLITSLNGCIEIIAFTIEYFEPLTLELQNNTINEITAIADGGKKEYTYYFDSVSNGNDNTIFINQSGTYTVTVVDENGCEAVNTIEMEFIDINIPNFFTPDEDGTNDNWTPKNTDGFPNILTIIFDRYGRELYRMGQDDEGWNGIYQNSEVPTGDYWYVIKLKGENDDREFVGNFTLYR